MRSEKEMMDLILGVAGQDERVRGVYMNGSRTNPNAPHDIFQDYDIVYAVKETASFIADESWIDVFGKRLYMQMPDKMDAMSGMETNAANSYAYLMQFADGNRMDLTVMKLEYAVKNMKEDKLCVVLLDKDGVLPEIPAPSDECHWVKKPTAEEYFCCCNEFWWMQNSVGKGLWRREMTYAMDMMNLYIRPQLIKMLSWYVGMQEDFSCSVGKSGKYLHRYLSGEEYGRLMLTYPNSDRECVWKAVYGMCSLFDETARKVGDGLGYPYDGEEAQGSRLFLDYTYGLAEDAEDIRMDEKPYSASLTDDNAADGDLDK